MDTKRTVNNWKLPESLNVGGSLFRIRTDFRDVLTIFQALNDPDLPDFAKTEVMLRIIYKDVESIPQEHMEEAVKKAMEFINHIDEDDTPDRKRPSLMDWEQDADLIIPAINKVSGVGDVRSLPYMHWWTFLGYYMEIGECLFSQVLSIRYKRAHGKKLEKWEKDFERENRNLIRLRPKRSEAEIALAEEERKALKALLGE